jgi:hypothetical protein
MRSTIVFPPEPQCLAGAAKIIMTMMDEKQTTTNDCATWCSRRRLNRGMYVSNTKIN